MATATRIPAALRLEAVTHQRKPFRPSILFASVLFLILAFIFLLPLYWMTISSFKPTDEIFSSGFNLIPTHLTTDGYTRLLTSTAYPRWFLNSVVQSGTYAVVTVAVCAMGGFALAKYRFRFRNLIFIAILIVQMVPFHLLIVSLFVLINSLGMVDKIWGAILPLAAHPIGLFYMRQYMLALEDDILDSARVDGANEFQLFFFIVMPTIRPAIATMLVLFSLEYWNNLLWPLIVFRSDQNFPLAAGIASMVNLTYQSDWAGLMAAATLATVPIIVLFFFLRRQFMEGATITGTGVEK